jgi:uncharacterized protein YhhL (DUF1145 family)
VNADVPTVVRARPRRIRILVWITAPVIVVLFALIALSLQGTFNDEGAAFQPIDRVAMFLLGVLAALGTLIFTRPSVEADASGVRVRNLLGYYDLPWDAIRAITFHRGAPWAFLELTDDDRVAVLAVQAADKEHAVRAVRGLRALHAAAQTNAAAPGPGATARAPTGE